MNRDWRKMAGIIVALLCISMLVIIGTAAFHYFDGRIVVKKNTPSAKPESQFHNITSAPVDISGGRYFYLGHLEDEGDNAPAILSKKITDYLGNNDNQDKDAFLYLSVKSELTFSSISEILEVYEGISWHRNTMYGYYIESPSSYKLLADYGNGTLPEMSRLLLIYSGAEARKALSKRFPQINFPDPLPDHVRCVIERPWRVKKEIDSGLKKFNRVGSRYYLWFGEKNEH